MPGIFGTNALLQTDLSLLLQIIAFLILLIGYGYKMKGKFKMHGSFMGAAVILHALSFLLVMLPSFLVGFEFFTTETHNLGVQTTLLHAVTGAIALILGIGIVAAWAFQPSDTAACSKRKRLMNVTILLWVVSLIFGTATYLILYL
jgi:uncharacterized membrane protein YozB (DUF420 family)